MKRDMIRRRLVIVCSLFAIHCLLFSCAHPAYEAKEKETATVSKVFNTDANEAYYAVRWALKTGGYSITNEDLENGIITSGWLSSKADSFYIAPFGHTDYGADGAYYRLKVVITPEDGASRTNVSITSQVKSMVAHLISSQIEEKRILGKISDYLRKADISVTNIGIEE